jgi:hypothetical protein
MIGTEARGAWKELERHLRPYLARRVASAADIDDLLQDIFVSAEREDPTQVPGVLPSIRRLPGPRHCMRAAQPR